MKKILIFSIFLFLFSCAKTPTTVVEEVPVDDYVKPTEYEAKEVEDEVSVPSEKKTEKVTHREKTAPIKVVWSIPREQVDRFHLYYGPYRHNLSNHIVVEVDDLERITHPKYGPAFSYKLEGINRDQTLYLSIRAENEAGISEASDPILLLGER